ncbi:MAG: hypothetical protein ACXVFO_08030 [Solirubrobacteraceae bacterium]
MTLPTADEIRFERDERGFPVNAEQFETAVAVAIQSIKIRPGRGKLSERIEHIEWTIPVDVDELLVA